MPLDTEFHSFLFLTVRYSVIKEISNISVGVTYFHFLVNFSIQPDERILVKYHMHGGSIFLILKPSLHQFSF